MNRADYDRYLAAFGVPFDNIRYSGDRPPDRMIERGGRQ